VDPEPDSLLRISRDKDWNPNKKRTGPKTDRNKKNNINSQNFAKQSTIIPLSVMLNLTLESTLLKINLSLESWRLTLWRRGGSPGGDVAAYPVGMAKPR
jgi:hypothetical protein